MSIKDKRDEAGKMGRTRTQEGFTCCVKDFNYPEDSNWRNVIDSYTDHTEGCMYDGFKETWLEAGI